jgi:hypothetical protein
VPGAIVGGAMGHPDAGSLLKPLCETMLSGEMKYEIQNIQTPSL